jgi:rhodanese-related sulfurtransferase
MGIPTVSVSGVPDPIPEAVHVLDVREDDEFAYGHIEGAQHIPMMEIPSRVHELPDTQILVVCKVGSRSAQVTAYLASHGYDAVNLDGGMYDWDSAGRPMVSDTVQPPTVL